MSRSSARADLAWGYLAQALNLGAGVLLLPVVVRFLPPAQVGLWFVFLTLGALAQLLEFGFQPTLARNMAYAYAGASNLQAQGVPQAPDAGSSPNLALAAQLQDAAQFIYRWVAIAAAGVLALGGGSYLMTLVPPAQAQEVLWAWALYGAGQVWNFYYGYLNGLMQGRGDVAAANKVVIVARLAMLLSSVAALVAGAGLVGLGVASFLSCLVGRLVALRLYRRGAPAPQPVSSRERREILRVLWPNASRLGLVQLGAFLIQRANVLIASSVMGVAAAASFGLTATLLTMLSGVSSVVLQLRIPRLAAAQAARDMPSLRGLFGEVVLLALGVFGLGLGVLLCFGDNMLKLVHSQTPLLPPTLVALLGLVTLLELNHSIAAGYLTTRNRVPFLAASLISGAGIATLSLLWVGPWGALGLIAAQGLVQGAYNNWKWPRAARVELQASWAEILILGVRKLLGRTRSAPVSSDSGIPNDRERK